MSSRGRCVYCGMMRSLTKAGLVRKHHVIAGSTTLTPGKWVVCGGSGRQPS